MSTPSTSVAPPETWWEDAFPIVPYRWSPPGKNTMLILVAYDITDHRRLSKVAKACEDYGVRVQYSLFECRLDQIELAALWTRLNDLIDDDEDRIVAYQLDSRSSDKTLTAGNMVCSEDHLCYLIG